MAKDQRQEIIKTVRFRECELRLFEKTAAKEKQEFSEGVRSTLRQAVGK
jgi:hypothetical protein